MLKYFRGSWKLSQFTYITVGVDFHLPWRYINLYWWWLETRQAPTIWSSLRIYLFHWKKRHKETAGNLKRGNCDLWQVLFFINVCLSMENEQPTDLFSLTLLNRCAAWSYRQFLNLLYLLDFLILLTQIDLVYRVYVLFQVNHGGLIACIINTLWNDRPIYRI